MDCARRLIAIIIVLAIAGCIPSCADRGPQQPNIVLISIDMLRADHFTPEHMPHTYSWAKENCAVFPKAYSNSTWTIPSHATMFSGLLQSQHKAEYQYSVMSEDVTMIQEKLKSAGYDTLAYTGSGFVSRAIGFARGFDHMSMHALIPAREYDGTFMDLRKIAWESTKKAEEAVSERETNKPLFLFLHSNIMHEYWLYRYDPDARPEKGWDILRKEFLKGSPPETLRKYYGVAAKDLDTKLHAFIEMLLESKLGPNLVIILTSDHGEGLGDTYEDVELVGHNRSPYICQIHIPLVIYGIPKGQYDGLIGISDIPGIIESLAGLGSDDIIPSHDYIISEFVKWRAEDKPEGIEPEIVTRSVSLTYPDKRILLHGDGKLHIFTDKEDQNDSLSFDVKETYREMSEEEKAPLRAIGYLE